MGKAEIHMLRLFAELYFNWCIDRYGVRVALISQHAHYQLLSFSYVNFRYELDYVHSETRRQRFLVIT